MASKHSIQFYRYWYTRLLRLYPKPYFERFGEAMAQTFNDLLQEHQADHKELIRLALWMFADTSVGIIKENVFFTTMRNKNSIRLAAITALLLLIPVFGNAYVDGWNWSLFDFIFAGTLIFGTGLIYELVVKRSAKAAYRVAVAMALAAAFLLIWVNGAVGIIGDEGNQANLLYAGVIITLFLGSIISLAKPRGMSYTLFAAAAVQAMVPVVAFFIWRPVLDETPGAIGVFVLNSFFVMLLLGSGILFRSVAHEQAGADTAQIR